MDVRKAVKQLSSGHQFRSLYGLLRDQHAMTAAHKGETMAQKAVAEAAKVISPYRSLMAAPARTQSLSQTKSKPSSQMDAVILQAEKDLKRKGKMELLHEKATIVKMARELANVAATKSARSEVRLGNPPASLLQGQPEGEPQQLAQAPEQSWSSSTGPAGQQAQWSIMQGQSLSAQEPAPEAEVGQVRPLSEYVRRQSNEMHRRLAFPANEQHLPIVEKVHNALMRRLPAAAEKAIDAHQAQTSPYDEPPYNRFHARGRFHYDLDQVQPRYPSYAPPFPPQQPQSVEKQPSSPLEMREQVSGVWAVRISCIECYKHMMDVGYKASMYAQYHSMYEILTACIPQAKTKCLLSILIFPMVKLCPRASITWMARLWRTLLDIGIMSGSSCRHRPGRAQFDDEQEVQADGT